MILGYTLNNHVTPNWPTFAMVPTLVYASLQWSTPFIYYSRMIEPCIKNTVPLSIPICSFNNNVEVERPELNEVHLPQCLNVGDHRLAREEERATRSLDGSSLSRRVPVFVWL